MAIIEINKRAKFEDIVANKETGVICSYIDDGNASKIIRQVKYADKLNKTGTSAYIEVKFVSKYSEREKRIEIVSKREDIIIIYKLSKSNHFDKDAIEMQKLIEEIKTVYAESNYQFIGSLLFSLETDMQSISEHLATMGIEDIIVSNY